MEMCLRPYSTGSHLRRTFLKLREKFEHEVAAEIFVCCLATHEDCADALNVLSETEMGHQDTLFVRLILMSSSNILYGKFSVKSIVSSSNTLSSFIFFPALQF